jgi:uncharacterized phage infection (PIP) family protein YhgE
MAKEKSETFVVETEVLNKAKEVLNQDELSKDDLYKEFENLCNEYGKLLDEAKFLTKISDKLENKLNAANDKLRDYNEALAQEADTAKTEREKALQKSKQLSREKSEADTQLNKQQILLVILIALLAINLIILIMIMVFGVDVVKSWFLTN